MNVVNIIVVLSLLGLSSCLTIVNPLGTFSNIINDSRIEGPWVDAEGKEILVQKLSNSKFKNVFNEVEPKDYTREDSIYITKSYVINFREDKLDYTWLGSLVEINGYYYLNLRAEECLSNGKDIYGGFATSSIAKLSWTGDSSIALGFLNGDHIKEIILNAKARIRHVYEPLFGTFIITASSQELYQFLEKYGNDSRLFKGGNSMLLTRKI